MGEVFFKNKDYEMSLDYFDQACKHVETKSRKELNYTLKTAYFDVLSWKALLLFMVYLDDEAESTIKDSLDILEFIAEN
jgi:hypothetical protein